MTRNNDIYDEEDIQDEGNYSKRKRIYDDDEDDNDLWDDELDINVDESSKVNTESTDDNVYTDTPESYEEPKDSNKPTRRKRFFGGGIAEESDNDFYDSDSEDAPVKKQPEPKLDPEDPDYWIEESESTLNGIMPSPRRRWIWWMVAASAAIVMILTVWILYLRPYTEGGIKYGYIKDMEYRGTILKTFEGNMIPYKELGDTDPLYYTELPFSVECDSVAARMKEMMLGCIPVRIEYKEYRTSLPWKGEQKLIIIRADSADPRKILPPEYRR